MATPMAATAACGGGLASLSVPQRTLQTKTAGTMPQLDSRVTSLAISSAAATAIVASNRRRAGRGLGIAMRQSAAQAPNDPMAALKAQQEEMRRRIAAKKAKKQQKQASAGAGTPAAPPAPWRLAQHPSAPGQWYYYNDETGETRWDPPTEQSEPEPASNWRQVEHPSNPGQFYYYNEATQETSWETPPGFEVEEEKKEGAEMTKKEEEAEMKKQEEEAEMKKQEKEAEKMRKQEEAEMKKKEKEAAQSSKGAAGRLLRGESIVEAVEEEPMNPADLKIATAAVDEIALKNDAEELDDKLKLMQEMAKQRRAMMKARRMVMSGKKKKTTGGLTKDDLMVNKRGKIVSKKQSARGQKTYALYLKTWQEAVMTARSKMNVQGFIPINGRTKEGQELYQTAKKIYEDKKAGS